jgi:type III secretory pathway component EscS
VSRHDITKHLLSWSYATLTYVLTHNCTWSVITVTNIIVDMGYVICFAAMFNSFIMTLRSGKTMLDSSSLPFVLKIVHVLFMLYVFIYVHWCPTRFPYQMMFVSFNSNRTGVTCGAGTANPSGAPEFIRFLWGSC